MSFVRRCANPAKEKVWQAACPALDVRIKRTHGRADRRLTVATLLSDFSARPQHAKDVQDALGCLFDLWLPSSPLTWLAVSRSLDCESNKRVVSVSK